MSSAPSPRASALLLRELFELRREPHHADSAPGDARHKHQTAAFYIAPRRAGGRWLVTTASVPSAIEGKDDLSIAHHTMHARRPSLWRALPREKVGDGPQKYHPLYAAAILSAKVESIVTVTLPPAKPPTSPAAKPVARRLSLAQWPIPRLDWTTADEVRRSMTLNGMRMSMEYAQTGSLRVLQLVESRLAAGQRDVAHDVLVYLMRQVMDVRAAEREARDLRAEAVAAYLGLSEPQMRLLFAARRLAPAAMSAAIAGGFAGPVRRSIDVPALIASQLSHLRPQLQALKHQEDQWLWLLDQIAARLYV